MRFRLYILLAMLSVLCTGSLHAQRIQEASIKAAYLTNFLEFIDGANVTPRKIGILGAPKVMEQVLAIASSSKSSGREHIQVVALDPNDSIESFTLVFVAEGHQEHWAELSQKALSHRVVLVGEGSGFLEQGGLIELVLARNRLRFKVNRRRAEDLGFSFSSKLLDLALEVR